MAGMNQTLEAMRSTHRDLSEADWRFGGMFLRMQTSGYEGPVHLNRGATVGAVFEV